MENALSIRERAVLIVEDDPIDVIIVERELNKLDSIRVEVAENVNDAIERIHSVQFDLVLTDLALPGTNGMDLITSVRRENANLPVILVTAYGHDSLEAKAIELGATHYVPKKDIPSKLCGLVEHILGMARGDTEDDHELTKNQT